VLKEEHLAIKKPGTGIPVAQLPEVIGRTLRHPVKADLLLREPYLT